MRFTDAYAAAPVCSPTRASILTGKSPARLRITDWLPGRGDKLNSGSGAWKSNPSFHSKKPPSPKRCVADGYKPHSSENGTSATILSIGQSTGASTQPRRLRRALRHPTSPYKLRICPTARWRILTDRLTSEAIGFIEQNRDKPFLVYLSHYAVHNPLKPNPVCSKIQSQGLQTPHWRIP